MVVRRHGVRKFTEEAQYIFITSKWFFMLLMRAKSPLSQYPAVQLNSCSSFRIHSSVRAYVPLLVAQLACRMACQPSLPSCLERRARSELVIRRGSGIFTIYPHVDLVRVEAELNVRQYRQGEETVNHEQGTIPMILADSTIGLLYHHTTSLYSFPLTTAL